MSKDLENKAGDNNITDEFCSDVSYNRDGVYKYKRKYIMGTLSKVRLNTLF